MVKDKNIRVSITFTRKKAEWLQKSAKKAGMTLSKFCNMLINYNLQAIANYKTEEELIELRRIVRTPWLD